MALMSGCEVGTHLEPAGSMALIRKRLLIVVETGGGGAEFVASLSQKRRCIVAVTADPDVELRRRSVQVLVRLLEQDGFTASVSVEQHRAVQALRPPLDALVVDVSQPRLQCIAFARYVRSLMPGLPIIFVTSHPELFDPKCRGLSPPVAVFGKPIDYVSFRAELDRLTRRQSGLLRVAGAERRARRREPGG